MQFWINADTNMKAHRLSDFQLFKGERGTRCIGVAPHCDLARFYHPDNFGFCDSGECRVALSDCTGLHGHDLRCVYEGNEGLDARCWEGACLPVECNGLDSGTACLLGGRIAGCFGGSCKLEDCAGVYQSYSCVYEDEPTREAQCRDAACRPRDDCEGLSNGTLCVDWASRDGLCVDGTCELPRDCTSDFRNGSRCIYEDGRNTAGCWDGACLPWSCGGLEDGTACLSGTQLGPGICWGAIFRLEDCAGGDVNAACLYEDDPSQYATCKGGVCSPWPPAPSEACDGPGCANDPLRESSVRDSVR